MEINLDWTQFKALLVKKQLPLQYVEYDEYYLIWTTEQIDNYFIKMEKTSSNVTEFEADYKPTANASLAPKDDQGKTVSRTDSRPFGYMSYFTSRGDTDLSIGDGTEMRWDFSNDDDLISVPSGVDYKTKRIEFSFLDPVYIKEGALYFKNAPFGTYVNLNVICPSGQYYLNNNGVPTLATEDTVVGHFVNHHFLIDTCTMGDELNTESCGNEIPTFIKMWFEITVPITCTDCVGYASLELYRKRTVIL